MKLTYLSLIVTIIFFTTAGCHNLAENQQSQQTETNYHQVRQTLDSILYRSYNKLHNLETNISPYFLQAYNDSLDIWMFHDFNPQKPYQIKAHEVGRGQAFYQIAGPYSNIDDSVLRVVERVSPRVYDVRLFATGRPYFTFESTSKPNKLLRIAYKPNNFSWVFYNFEDSFHVETIKRPYIIKEKALSGIVKSTLYGSIVEQDGPIRLTAAMFDVFAWTFNFDRIDPGDKYKVIYEEQMINGKRVGLEKVLAAWMEIDNKEYYGFYFNTGEGPDYFNENGKNIRKAPLKFEKISSRFKRGRFHTVLRRYRSHKGMDFTGPEGRPVYAIDDGTIVKAEYKRNNGNYVKINHGSYKSQYLHFSKIADGLNRGDRVKKGQLIGYLGQTGLASGPHVCFRIWKNGRQVDPIKLEEIPFPDSLPDSLMPEFNKYKNKMMERFENMTLKSN